MRGITLAERLFQQTKSPVDGSRFLSLYIEILQCDTLTIIGIYDFSLTRY